MYVKNLLVEKLSLVVTEEDNVGDDDSTTTINTDPEFPSSTVITTDLTSSSSSTEVTSPGTGEDDENGNKWVLPLIIGLSSLLLISGVAVIVVIYRKRKCFGSPLPCINRKVRLAQPLKTLADSVRSSISSTFSSSGGSTLGGDGNKQFKKYAVRLHKKVEGGTRVSGVADERDLDWTLEKKDFSGEFEAVKRADMKEIPVKAALKGENVLKNRFSNVLPYDKTRVVLTAGASGNDYVNASYISGYRKEREFICTQGPLRNTVADFWQMCWETHAVAVVMLTKCYENNQEKCYPYWPSGDTGYSKFGDIKVTLERKTTWMIKSGKEQDVGNNSEREHLWQASELTMEKDGETGTQSIIHIVFLSWPDFGLVDPPSCLVSFIRNVKESVRSCENNNNGQTHGPIVVHCSAGVGRSGVFIAVDHLIQQLDEFANEENSRSINLPSVNIFQIVAKMRKERMGMVQNSQQYTLIYKCFRVLVNQNENVEPSIVSNEVIQGSDWGLINSEANIS